MPPAVEVGNKTVNMVEVFEDGSGKVLPGEAMADLDWEESEEATSVFDRSNADLFSDLTPKPRVMEAEEASKRGVGNAAALLASSGRSAQNVPAPASAGAPAPMLTAPMVAAPGVPGPMPMMTAPMTSPYSDDMPRIPAPAPVPRDISPMRDAGFDGSGPRGAELQRAPHPSWAPAVAQPQVQPRSGGGKSTLLLALVATLVLAAAGFFYLRAAASATVEIHVTHEDKEVEKANVYVDGQKMCEFAPCKLDLKPGTKQVRVVSGDLAGQISVDVHGGKDVSVTVPLEKSEEAPVEKKEPPKLKLATAMKDANLKVFVNGQEKGALTSDKPLELEGLEPGKLTLRFEGGEKWGKLEKQVELKEGETLELKDIELPLLKVKVTFRLATKGANVKLIKQEGEKKTDEPLAFRGNEIQKELDTTFIWIVQASLKGYDNFEQTIAFEGNKPEQDFEIKLEKEKEKVATPTPSPTPTPGPGPKPEPAAGGHGFINANSIPPSKVVIGGRPYGSTPVTGVKVPAGTHTVVFRHDELGTEARTVTVGNGQTKTATVRFKKKEE
ncbi:MAG TPA: PEGA domain-containing protein [Polyangiaceae bacterium]|nr:PEGA domain-containing protein [Polyangiaceae bacterium]